MFNKKIFIIATALLLMPCGCIFARANSDENGGSDEVISFKKEQPSPAATAPAGVSLPAATAGESPLPAASAVVTAAVSVTGTVQETISPVGGVQPAKKEKSVEKKHGRKTVSVQPVVNETAEKIPAGQEKISALIEKIKAKQSARKAMICDIVIKTSYVSAGAAQEVKGSLTIKKKNKFKVHYTEPSEQIMVSDGKTLWVYTPGLKQVIKQDAKDANLDTNFYIEIENSIEYFVKNSKTALTEDDNIYILTMIPKDRKILDFDEITVKIEKADLIPLDMSMKYESGIMEVLFSNIKNYSTEETEKQEALNDKNFEFITPEGAQEIEASSLIDAAAGK